MLSSEVSSPTKDQTNDLLYSLFGAKHLQLRLSIRELAARKGHGAFCSVHSSLHIVQLFGKSIQIYKNQTFGIAGTSCESPSFTGSFF